MTGVYNLNKLIGCYLEYGTVFNGHKYRVKYVFDGGVVAYSTHKDYGSAVEKLISVRDNLHENNTSTITFSCDA